MIPEFASHYITLTLIRLLFWLHYHLILFEMRVPRSPRRDGSKCDCVKMGHQLHLILSATQVQAFSFGLHFGSAVRLTKSNGRKWAHLYPTSTHPDNQYKPNKSLMPLCRAVAFFFPPPPDTQPDRFFFFRRLFVLRDTDWEHFLTFLPSVMGKLNSLLYFMMQGGSWFNA